MKFLKLLLFFIFFSKTSYCQFIETIVSDKYKPVLISINTSGLDAANLIASEFNKWGAFKCSHTLVTSLSKKIDQLRLGYNSSIPSGSNIDFLVLINKFNCEVIGLVHKNQTIRIKDNKCSVNDIQLVSPDLVFDSEKTGFFTISIKAN